MTYMTWFEVDKEGLQDIFPRIYVVRELVANILDEIPNGCTKGTITIRPLPNGYSIRAVDDSPRGFVDLTDSFTLFRYTDKRKNPEVRGRFNAGDKYVLAHADYGLIRSTTGTYYFNPNNEKLFIPHEKTQVGSEIDLLIDLDVDEYEYMIDTVKLYKPPKGFNMTLEIGNEDDNSVDLKDIAYVKPKAVATGNLPTWYLNADDVRKTLPKRKTKVYIYKEKQSYIYEMGIPIQSIDDPFSYDVQQKIPLDQNRDVVSNKYLRELRGICIKAIEKLLDEQELAENWVTDALESKNIPQKTFDKVISRKFENGALYSSNQQANERAILAGKQIIHSRELSQSIRDRVEVNKVIPKAMSFMPNIKEVDRMTTSALTDEMRQVRRFTEGLSKRLIGFKCYVEFINDKDIGSAASFGTTRFTYNIAKLGKTWFEQDFPSLLELILHEFGHSNDNNSAMPHLSQQYVDRVVEISAKAVRIALVEPEFFNRDNY